MLRLTNIKKTYTTGETPVDALRGVNLQLDSCGMYFVVGKSGSGKSTLLNVLGLLDEYEGEYSIFVIDGMQYRFVIVTQNYKEIRSIEVYFELFVNVFGIMSAVLCIFTALLTFGFINQSIALRTKDIGILRSLGASQRDVAFIFIFEGIIIAFFEILFGIITCFAGYYILDNYFIIKLGEIVQLYDIISFTIRQPILMTLATLAAVALALILPIYKIARRQPISIIRNG